jgi:hypothetical protein
MTLNPFSRSIFFALTLVSFVAQAGNHILSGTRQDGAEVTYESDPPGYVVVKTKGNSASRAKNIVVFEGEECSLIYPFEERTLDFDSEESLANYAFGSSFSCSASGKSPLAGTRYIFERHVGDGCKEMDDYDIYICVSGCNEHALKRLEKGGYCGPC